MWRYTKKGTAKGDGKCNAIIPGARGGSQCRRAASRVIHLGKPHADGGTHSFVACEECFARIKKHDKSMKPWPYNKNDARW